MTLNDRDKLYIAIIIIWAGVAIASAIILRGTDYFGKLLLTYGLGAFTSILVCSSATTQPK